MERILKNIILTITFLFSFGFITAQELTMEIPVGTIRDPDFVYGVQLIKTYADADLYNIFFSPNKKMGLIFLEFEDEHQQKLVQPNISSEEDAAKVQIKLYGFGETHDDDLLPNYVDTKPTDITNTTQPLTNLLSDVIKEEFKKSKKSDIRNVTIVSTTIEMDGDKILSFGIYNHSSSVKIPDEYFKRKDRESQNYFFYYVDMSRIQDREKLVEDLEDKIKNVIDDPTKEYLLFVSNGENPLYAYDKETYDGLLNDIWVLQTLPPSINRDGKILKQMMGGIDKLENGIIEFHFYIPPDFCESYFNTFMCGKTFPEKLRRKDNFKVFLHIEQQEGEGYVIKTCPYKKIGECKTNPTGNIKCDCMSSCDCFK